MKDIIIQLSKRVGTITATSSIYESESWGFEHPMPFLNQVVEVKSKLDPLCLLEICQQIEVALGRKRFTQGYAARNADIDILFIDDFIFTLPPLILPHKHLHDRMFVLEPLCEIAPNFIHPMLGCTISELKNKCEDNCEIWKYEAKVSS